ncbi:MAG TPA: MBL fold metallo-hydrolase, partial [Myxococcales bacterium]|nr:MBL fold metallo-hydrolase [Myxococcales bacterium]
MLRSSLAVPAALAALLALFPAASFAGPFRFTTIDIGQGDGAVVVAPSGCAALLDGGPTGAGAKIKSYLRSIGVTQVDLAVVSHFHADHLGGLDEVEQGADGI